MIHKKQIDIDSEFQKSFGQFKKVFDQSDRGVWPEMYNIIQNILFSHFAESEINTKWADVIADRLIYSIIRNKINNKRGRK